MKSRCAAIPASTCQQMIAPAAVADPVGLRGCSIPDGWSAICARSLLLHTASARSPPDAQI